MYFVALVLTLRRPLEEQVPLQEELSSVCEALKDALTHTSQPGSHHVLSVALVAQSRRFITLRVTFAEQSSGSATPRVLQVLLSLPGITLGQRTYRVESLDLASAPWTGISTWDDLLCGNSGSRIRFSLATPLLTVYPQGPCVSGAGPFPEAIWLFSQLSRCWETLNGPALAQDVEQAVFSSRCTVSSYRIRTTTGTKAGNHYTGYLGWMEYETLLHHRPATATLCALARLAHFSGIGARTEEGMGSALVSIFS